MTVHHRLLSRLRQGLQDIHSMRGYLLFFIVIEGIGLLVLATTSPAALALKASVMTVMLTLMLGVWFQLNRSKAMLAHSAEHLQRITESLGEGLLVINAYKMITFVNPAAERLLQYAPDELTGKTLHAVFRNHTSECPICQAIAQGLKYHSDEQTASTKTENLLPVELTVSDIGQGIDADGLSKIFRTDLHYTRAGTAGEPGTGLGLNVCKEMVEKQGGAIQVESVVGQGTTFRFTLPIALRQPAKGCEHGDKDTGG